MSTLRLTGEILAAAHRQLAHRLDRPHPGWRQDPVLAHRTIGELVDAVHAGDDPTIRAIIRHTLTGDQDAPVVLLAGLGPHLVQRACWNTHGHLTPAAIDEHATIAYLVILDADPTQTDLQRRLLGRVTSRYRKHIAAEQAHADRHHPNSTIPDADSLTIFERRVDPTADVDTIVDAALGVDRVLDQVAVALDNGDLRPEAWHAFVDRRVYGRTPNEIANTQDTNPSTVRSWIHRTARWVDEHLDAA